MWLYAVIAQEWGRRKVLRSECSSLGSSLKRDFVASSITRKSLLTSACIVGLEMGPRRHPRGGKCAGVGGGLGGQK